MSASSASGSIGEGSRRGLLSAFGGRIHDTSVVSYCLWFAAVVSLGEMACLSVLKEFSRYRVLGFEHLWRVPIGYGLIYGVIAILGMAGAGLRRRAVPAAVVLASTFVATIALVSFAISGLHPTALILLAIGAAYQAFRLQLRRAGLVNAVIRRTAVPAALLTIVVGATAYWWPSWTEARVLAAMPAAPADRPNVLLVVLDTVRARSLELYGAQRETAPNLSRFAGKGIVFDQAFSTSPWTLPSHGSMFTGRLPNEMSGGFNAPLDGTFPTLAEVLRAEGYLTAGFVANRHFGPPAYGLGRGFTHYEGGDHTSAFTSFQSTSFGQRLLASAGLLKRLRASSNFGRKNAERVNGDFLGWLSSTKGDRPFFAFLNYLDAHAPYAPPDEFATKFASTRPNGVVDQKPLDHWGPEEIAELNLAYDSSIAYLDHHLGLLFAELERRDLLRKTIVIVTSDHGEQFGEHGLMEHSNSLYLTLLHVPLVVVYPEHLPAGQRHPGRKSLTDLPATVLELSRSGGAAIIPGQSWFTPAQGNADDHAIVSEAHQVPANYPDWYPARKGPMASIIAGGFHYIVNHTTGSEELYSLTDDLAELRNISSGRPEIRTALRGRLDTTLGRSSDMSRAPGRKEN